MYQLSILVSPRNYEVCTVYLNYKSNKSARKFVTNSFWQNETVYPDQDEYKTNVTEEFTDKKLRRILRRCPSDVTEYSVEIKYTYNRKTYKLLVYNKMPDWPPEPPTEMKFTLPIISAYMIADADDCPMIDVTKCITRYNGPHNNFHGNKIKLRDILYSHTFKRVKITNAIRQNVILDIDTGVLKYPLF
jgi:hypothetical protein